MELIQKISLVWIFFAALSFYFLIRSQILLKKLTSKFNLQFNRNWFGIVTIRELMTAYWIIEDPEAKEKIDSLAATKKALRFCVILTLLFLIMPKIIHYWLI